ncbi:MAG TPA: branched-chain amino acid ABC transporter permease [Firmicutes bacterium]|nr:branched-chain amino acid ABC transporter permease [Bacillota bacterium]
MFLQTLITGLAIGGVYALMAVGYSLVFSILNFSNFAHGVVIMLGAYFGYYMCTLFHLPISLATTGAMLGAGLLAIANEKLAYRPLRLRSAVPLYFMISAMGASMFLENMVYVTVGAHFFSYPEVFKGSLSILHAKIGLLDVVALCVSAVAITGLTLFLNKAKLGIAIRAASRDMTVAGALGVNIDKLLSVVFFIAGAFAGIAGVFLGVKYMVYPTMGWITNKAYIAAVIGGIGSLPGAVIGGIILGVVESFVATYVSTALRDVFSFSLLVVLLMVMPSGLLGKTLEEKV